MADEVGFSGAFDDCRTYEQTNVRYKQLYSDLAISVDELREAHRRAMERIKNDAKDAADRANTLTLEGLGVTAAEVRDWCHRNDVAVGARGRLDQSILQWYAESTGGADEAH